MTIYEEHKLNMRERKWLICEIVKLRHKLELKEEILDGYSQRIKYLEEELRCKE